MICEKPAFRFGLDKILIRSYEMRATFGHLLGEIAAIGPDKFFKFCCKQASGNVRSGQYKLTMRLLEGARYCNLQAVKGPRHSVCLLMKDMQRQTNEILGR